MKVLDLVSVGMTRWLGLWQLTYQHGEKIHQWYFASRQTEADKAKLIQKLEGQYTLDAVSIIPFLKKGDDYELMAIKEFRPLTGKCEISFPAGLVDANETPLQAATRELREEIGLNVTEVFLVSPVVFSSAGLTTECLQVYFCIVEGEPNSNGAEADEDIEVLQLSRDKLNEIIRRQGEFADVAHSSRSWSILFFFWSMSQLFNFKFGEVIDRIRKEKCQA